MKQFFFIAGFVAFFLAACNKNDSKGTEEPDRLSLNKDDRFFNTEMGNTFSALDIKDILVSTDAASWAVSVVYGNSSDTGWVHVLPASGVSGTHVRIVADTNRNLQQRAATLIFRSGEKPETVLKELTVKVDPYLFAEMAAFVEVPETAGVTEVELYTNATSWTTHPTEEWLQAEEKEGSASFYRTLRITVGENPRPAPRSGKIEFTFYFNERWEYGELEIRQAGQSDS